MGLWFGNIQQGGAAPAVGWDLQFSKYSDGVTIDTTSDTQWSITKTGGGIAEVQSGRWFISNAGIVTWTSQLIDISTWGNVRIDLDAAMNGGQEPSDYFNSFYRINGGAETIFNSRVGSSSPQSWTASLSGLNGSNLQIILKMYNSASNEYTYCDFVTVTQE